ncbi:MAG: hypothetical protein D6762_09995 [Candidatus Neomarinimicrobiota bacterium]|nr:MAG: hypothetical protein D6762_09995 [Candidatus Neomarinimicrobiota bacterium]
MRFQVRGPATSAWTGIWVHGDEITARECLARWVAEGVRGYFVDSTTRKVNAGDLVINPNRIFTREEVRHHLETANPAAPDQHLDHTTAAIERDREIFLRDILPDGDGVLVALHNNFAGYALAAEWPSARKIHLPEPDRPRDFFLTVQEQDYRTLSRGPYNVVWQQAGLPSDGSLSWAAQQMGARYVNLEVDLGAETRQWEMLTYLRQALGDPTLTQQT